MQQNRISFFITKYNVWLKCNAILSEFPKDLKAYHQDKPSSFNRGVAAPYTMHFQTLKKQPLNSEGAIFKGTIQYF